MEGPNANFGYKAVYNGPEGVEGLKVMTNTSTSDTTLLTKEQVDAIPVDITSVPTNKIRNNTITTTQIATSAITTAKIADSAVTTAKLADGAVETAKIANAAITLDKLQDGAVTAAKIGSGAVTTAKFAAGAVTVDKIADGAVDWPNVQNNAFTSAKIASGAVSSAKIEGTVTFDSTYFAANSVGTGAIPAGNVTSTKLSAPSTLDGATISTLSAKCPTPISNSTVSDAMNIVSVSGLEKTYFEYSGAVANATKRFGAETNVSTAAKNNFYYTDDTTTYVFQIFTAQGADQTLYCEKLNGDTINFMECIKDGSVVSEVRSNGDCYNATNTYGTISDERIKTDIRDIESQWNDAKNIKFIKYKLKKNMQAVKEAIRNGMEIPQDEDDDEDSPVLLGVMAQQLEEAGMTGLVGVDENGIKTVKTSVLQLKFFAALQELMTRVEALEEDDDI